MRQPHDTTGGLRFAMIPWALIVDPRVSHDGRRVFAYLQGEAYQQKDLAGAWTGAWKPTRPLYQGVIAEELGWPVSSEKERESSRRRVRRALQHLAALGYVKVMRWRGRGRACQFDLNPAWAKEAERRTLETLLSTSGTGDHATESEKRGHPQGSEENRTLETLLSPENRTPHVRLSSENRTLETLCFQTETIHNKTDRQDNGNRPSVSEHMLREMANDQRPQHPEADSSEMSRACRIARDTGVTQQGFIRSIEERRDLTAGDILAASVAFANSYPDGRGLKYPDRKWLDWLRHEKGRRSGEHRKAAFTAAEEDWS